MSGDGKIVPEVLCVFGTEIARREFLREHGISAGNDTVRTSAGNMRTLVLGDRALYDLSGLHFDFVMMHGTVDPGRVPELMAEIRARGLLWRR